MENNQNPNDVAEALRKVAQELDAQQEAQRRKAAETAIDEHIADVVKPGGFLHRLSAKRAADASAGGGTSSGGSISLELAEQPKKKPTN